MEVSLLASEGLPEGCILSVRAGTTRRQAPADDKFKLYFPKAQHEPFKVDAFLPLGSASLNLVEQNSEAAQCLEARLVNPKGDDTQKTMCVRLEVSKTTTSKEALPTREAPSKEKAAFPCPLGSLDMDRVKRRPESAATKSRRHRATVHAQRYLNEHKLLQWAELLFQDLIHDEPSDPWQYIYDHTRDVMARKAKEPRSPRRPRPGEDAIPGSPRLAATPAAAVLKKVTELPDEQLRNMLQEALHGTSDSERPSTEVLELQTPEILQNASRSATLAIALKATTGGADGLVDAPAGTSVQEDALRSQMRETLASASRSGSLCKALKATTGGADGLVDAPAGTSVQEDALRSQMRETLESASRSGSLCKALTATRGDAGSLADNPVEFFLEEAIVRTQVNETFDNASRMPIAAATREGTGNLADTSGEASIEEDAHRSQARMSVESASRLSTDASSLADAKIESLLAAEALRAQVIETFAQACASSNLESALEKVVTDIQTQAEDSKASAAATLTEARSEDRELQPAAPDATMATSSADAAVESLLQDIRKSEVQTRDLKARAVATFAEASADERLDQVLQSLAVIEGRQEATHEAPQVRCEPQLRPVFHPAGGQEAAHQGPQAPALDLERRRSASSVIGSESSGVESLLQDTTRNLKERMLAEASSDERLDQVLQSQAPARACRTTEDEGGNCARELQPAATEARMATSSVEAAVESLLQDIRKSEVQTRDLKARAVAMFAEASADERLDQVLQSQAVIEGRQEAAHEAAQAPALELECGKAATSGTRPGHESESGVESLLQDIRLSEIQIRSLKDRAVMMLTEASSDERLDQALQSQASARALHANTDGSRSSEDSLSGQPALDILQQAAPEAAMATSSVEVAIEPLLQDIRLSEMQTRDLKARAVAMLAEASSDERLDQVLQTEANARVVALLAEASSDGRLDQALQTQAVKGRQESAHEVLQKRCEPQLRPVLHPAGRQEPAHELPQADALVAANFQQAQPSSAEGQVPGVTQQGDDGKESGRVLYWQLAAMAKPAGGTQPSSPAVVQQPKFSNEACRTLYWRLAAMVKPAGVTQPSSPAVVQQPIISDEACRTLYWQVAAMVNVAGVTQPSTPGVVQQPIISEEPYCALYWQLAAMIKEAGVTQLSTPGAVQQPIISEEPCRALYWQLAAMVNEARVTQPFPADIPNPPDGQLQPSSLGGQLPEAPKMDDFTPWRTAMLPEPEPTTDPGDASEREMNTVEPKPGILEVLQAERRAMEEGPCKDTNIEAELLAKDEAERKGNEEAERKAKQEAELQAKDVAERKAKAQAERQAKEDAEREAKEAVEQQEAQRKATADALREIATREAEEKKKANGLRASASAPALGFGGQAMDKASLIDLQRRLRDRNERIRRENEALRSETLRLRNAADLGKEAVRLAKENAQARMDLQGRLRPVSGSKRPVAVGGLHDAVEGRQNSAAPWSSGSRPESAARSRPGSAARSRPGSAAGGQLPAVHCSATRSRPGSAAGGLLPVVHS